MQLSAIIAHGLFDRLGALGASGLRFAIAAMLVLLIVRPRLRGRTRGDWAMIALFGMCIAAMNGFLYLALDRLPLGVALTLEFLGPFAVAVVGARRPRAALFPAVGLLGVVAIVRPSGDLDVAGVRLALVAAAALAGYTVMAEKVGHRTAGVDGVALALLVAAVLTAPAAILAAPAVVAGDLLPLVSSAVLGVLVAFTADFLAVRLSSARTVAVLLSFDPVLAAVLGILLLGQALDPVTVVGIALVAFAGGAAARFAVDGRQEPRRRSGRDVAPRSGRASRRRVTRWARTRRSV